MKVGIQGVKGSYHHLVAQNYFESIELVECMTFDELTRSLVNEKCNVAVMAIENSIAGSILPNYVLIDENNFFITGECNFNINHNLLSLPNQDINDIKEVHSHPMALLQCSKFFSKHPAIKLIETNDTALFAKKISDNKLEGLGAIASIESAKMYDLEVLSESIQTIKNNVTRFVIVKKNIVEKKHFTKASLKFVLDHKRGSLASVLNVMSNCSLNLTKIQSIPIIKTPGQYAFFVDITFDKSDYYNKAISIIKIMAQEFKILGEY